MGVQGEGPRVVRAEDVAAEGEIAVRQPHLPEQSGRQVALRAKPFNGARTFHRAPCPNHGNVRAQRFRFVNVLVLDAVVGKQDEERVVPLRRLAQLTDELPYTAVKIVEGVENFVVEMPGHGHRPRLMAAQREQGGEPRRTIFGGGLRDNLEKAAEGDAVANAPLRCAALHQREVVFRHDGRRAGVEQVAACVGEVNVAAIDKG